VYSRRFDYVRAESLNDACDALRLHGEGAKVLAGGQSLLWRLEGLGS
jgi:CO/xanthine dehydrogenase FAD-binding subunit